MSRPTYNLYFAFNCLRGNTSDEFTTDDSTKPPLKEQLCNADGDSFQQKDKLKLHQR